MNGAENWDEASKWLRYAKEDLNTAQVLLEDECVPRHICWLAHRGVTDGERTVEAVKGMVGKRVYHAK